MTAHDPDLLERVANALWMHSPLDVVQGRAFAPAVLDALDLPTRDRRVKAEALRETATMLSRLADHGADGDATPYETADWLRHRAAELDPEEADDE